MFKGEIAMSAKDLKRLEVIQKVAEKRLKQAQAAHLLDCTIRTIQLLLQAFRLYGPSGLISKRRGKISNNACNVSINMTLNSSFYLTIF